MSSPPKTAASNLSQTSQRSFDSIDDQHGMPAPLSHHDAVCLARKMNQGLQCHTKDRMYRFKSYKACFKHSRALSWALRNIDTDESVAVSRLNELIDWGLVSHVVDPGKRFRANESRTLYFRIVQDVLNEEQLMHTEYGEPDVANISTENNGKHIIAINSSNLSRGMSDKMHDLQTKLDGLDHVLEQTVKELNAANGQLELMHQMVNTLVSQQTSLFTVVFMLFVYIILAVAPPSVPNNKWFSQPGLLAAFLMILLGKCSFIFINARSQLDYTKIVPEEVSDEDSSLGESTLSSNVKTHTKTSSFAKAVSERFGTVVSKKSSKSLDSTRKSVILMREAYSLPDIETWPHRPLLICVNTPVSINIKVPLYGLGPCPLGQPFEFSSDLFEGSCLIRIKESKSDDIHGDTEYFSGRKRIFQCVVQGRFKEDGLRVSDVLTGHEFARPLKNLPHPWILRTASTFIGRVAPGSNVVIDTDQPLVEAILAGTSQAVRGDEPGNEPSILTRDIQEDCSVFGGVFAKGGDNGISTARRKRIFSNPAKARRYKFDTEITYTFEFYQNLFDANSYSLDLGFAKIGCSKVLDGQPIQWLGKLRDGRYLWSFQIWHEKLLSAEGTS